MVGQTPPIRYYGMRSTNGGTHPTGMHSCFSNIFTCDQYEKAQMSQFSRDLTAPDRCYYLNQASLTRNKGRGRAGEFPVGEINRPQTVCMVMVIEQSLGSWSHMWGLNNVSGCGRTSLFGSRAGTHQGK